MNNQRPQFFGLPGVLAGVLVALIGTTAWAIYVERIDFVNPPGIGDNCYCVECEQTSCDGWWPTSCSNPSCGSYLPGHCPGDLVLCSYNGNWRCGTADSAGGQCR